MPTNQLADKTYNEILALFAPKPNSQAQPNTAQANQAQAARDALAKRDQTMYAHGVNATVRVIAKSLESPEQLENSLRARAQQLLELADFVNVALGAAKGEETQVGEQGDKGAGEQGVAGAEPKKD